MRIQEYTSELLSIITPVFNNVKDIEACLKSVANQTYINKEHWIIDGGSTDGALVFLKKYANKYSWIDIGSSFLPSYINAAFLYAWLLILPK